MVMGRALARVAGCLRVSAAAGVGTLLTLAAACGQAQACRAPAVEVEAGSERSRWSEYDATGRRLVREVGNLQTAGMGLSADCGGWRWQGRWLHAQGQRGYDGASNNGMALRSTSRIRREEARLQAWWSLDAANELGLEASLTQLHRDIAGAGGILGYPERFSAWRAGLGGRHAWFAMGGTDVAVEAWLGAGPAGHVDVALPGLDPARLRLGTSVSARVALSVSSAGAAPDAAGWQWRMRLALQQDRTGVGRPQPIYREGAIYGGAVQPRFEQASAAISAAVLYRF